MPFKKGNKPWNKGKSANPDDPNYDPRVAINIKRKMETMSKRPPIVPWIKGRTKETDPIVAEMGRKGAQTRKERGVKPWNTGLKGMQEPWNKGLSGNPDSPNYDPRVKDIAEKISITRKEKGIIPWIVGRTKDTDPILADAARRGAATRKSLGLKPWNKGLEGAQVAWNKGMSANPIHPNYHPGVAKSVKHLLQSKGGHRKENTDIEIMIQSELRKRGIFFITQVRIFGITKVDIFIPPNICIYTDGNRWHNYPHGTTRDIYTTQYLEQNEYVVLRFWGSDVRKKIDKCMDQIYQAIRKINSKNKQIPWNKGLSANPNNPNYDPRVEKNVQGLIRKNKEDHASGWNKGQTKHTDPRIAKQGRIQSEVRRNKFWSSWNKGLTKETDSRVADNVRKSGETIGRQLRSGEREVWSKGLTKEDHPSLVGTSEKNRVHAVNRKGKFPKKDTSIEIAIQEALESNGIDFDTDKPLLDITRVDVFIEPNICVYADGDYWHSIPKILERDERQTKTLKEKGYIVLRFTETEINSNIQGVVETIIKSMDSTMLH